MLWALIEFGGIAFWLFIAAFLLLETIFIYKDQRFSATVSLLLFAVLLQCFTTFNLWTFVQHNWVYCLYALGLYFVVGIIWGFIKWESFIGKRRADFDDSKRHFLETNQVFGKDVPADLQTKWSIYIINKNQPRYEDRVTEQDLVSRRWTPERIKNLVIPSARNEKSRIVTWMAYWPFSFIATVLCDIIVDAWNWLYNNLHQFFQYRAKAKFAGVEKEFAIPTPPAQQKSSDYANLG